VLCPGPHRKLPWHAAAGLLALAAAACLAGGDDEPEDTQLRCAAASTGEEEQQIPLRLGSRTDAGFSDLEDGQDIPLVLGPQGIWMLMLDVRLDEMPLPVQKFCWPCEAQLRTTTGSFEDEVRNLQVTFYERADGALESTFIFTVGEQVAPFAETDVEFTLSCHGHGFAATAHEQLHLVEAQ
jgi:hypothetical protein